MIAMRPIGMIHSPFTTLQNMPIQPAGAGEVRGTVEIFTDYRAGLKDLDGFSHIILIYLFHRSEDFNLEVVPFLDSERRGLFATRAPRRPNPIGLSTVRLDRIENATLFIRNVDIIDGTPLLDIKPHVPDFDSPAAPRIGWLAHVPNKVATHRSDERFVTTPRQNSR